MQLGGQIVRRRLPDGRAVVFERWDVDPALGVVAWNVFFEGEPLDGATGAPLVFVLAHLLGHDVPERWPWWLYSLADDVEAAFALPP